MFLPLTVILTHTHTHFIIYTFHSWFTAFFHHESHRRVWKEGGVSLRTELSTRSWAGRKSLGPSGWGKLILLWFITHSSKRVHSLPHLAWHGYFTSPGLHGCKVPTEWWCGQCADKCVPWCLCSVLALWPSGSVVWESQPLINEMAASLDAKTTGESWVKNRILTENLNSHPQDIYWLKKEKQ